MNAKHTPGPWYPVYSIETGTFNNSFKIGTSDVIVARTPTSNGHETEANARLIAAAPDLLAACEAVDKMLAGPAAMFDLNGMRNILRPAIAKARGES